MSPEVPPQSRKARRAAEREAQRNVPRAERKEAKRRESATIAGLRLHSWLLIAAAVVGGGVMVDRAMSHGDTPLEPVPVSAPAPDPVPQETDTPDKSFDPDKQKYVYQIDGVNIESKTVSEAAFRKAYDHAKGIVGGPYWKPTTLSVEYGDVAPIHLTGAKEENVVVKGSWISQDLTQIISGPQELPHEIAHFLLGPDAHRWPVILEEFIASACDGDDEKYDPVALNQPWVRMGSLNAFKRPSLLLNTRYEALRYASEGHRGAIPFVVAAAMPRTDLTLANIGKYLEGFGIKHNILNPGNPGEQIGFCKYSGRSGNGYLFTRYRRGPENDEDMPWTGKIVAIFRDKVGNIYEGSPIDMKGVIPIIPPSTPHPLVSIQIQSEDGGTLEAPLQ